MRKIIHAIAVLAMLIGAGASRADDALAEKTAVLSGEIAVPTRSTSFGMDLLLGQMMGIRPNFAINVNDRSAVAVEGFYGALLSKFGDSEAAGLGARWVSTRGGIDSVILGPGVDVFFHFNDGKAVILAPNLDIAWRHSFGNRAGLVLGMNAGVGIGMSGRERDDGDSVSGKVSPIISFYSGLRY
jgi:hypothetical protein